MILLVTVLIAVAILAYRLTKRIVRRCTCCGSIRIRWIHKMEKVRPIGSLYGCYLFKQCLKCDDFSLARSYNKYLSPSQVERRRKRLQFEGLGDCIQRAEGTHRGGPRSSWRKGLAQLTPPNYLNSLGRLDQPEGKQENFLVRLQQSRLLKTRIALPAVTTSLALEKSSGN